MWVSVLSFGPGAAAADSIRIVVSGAIATAPVQTGPVVIGRYALFDELASGGMATVHLGRLLGPVGFGRTVAVKRLHEHFLKDEEFIAMFMDEARIVARIRHPNVVPMVDVVQSDKGLFLIMEYVHGETLSRLLRTCRANKELIPPKIVTSILYGVLLGLHGAHETKGADGTLLGVVHRDVSPQNIIVGADGTARVLDFGIAKAAGRAQVTREGQIKGKLAYMAPEQIRGQVDRRTDVFAASVVLWEALAGRRLHEGSKDVDIVTRVIKGGFSKPSEHVPGISPELDAIVMKGLETNPENRYPSARDLAIDLEKRIGLAPTSEVVAWVERNAHDVLEARSALVSSMELVASDLVADDEAPPPSLSFSGPRSATTQAAPHSGSLDTVPIEMDPAGNPDPSTGTSAVFAHTRTSGGAAVDEGARRPTSLKPILWIIAACALLALVGVLLGAYALLQRASTTPLHPSSSQTPNASSPPSVTAPPASASAPTAASSTPPSVATAHGSSGVAAPAVSSAPAASALPAIAPPATATTKVGSGGTPVGPGVVKPPPKKPPPAANCDPPYTVDEVGHRKYKTECLGGD